jgi:hypothetical protein
MKNDGPNLGEFVALGITLSVAGFAIGPIIHRLVSLFIH